MPVFAVTTAKGANWDRPRGIRQQPFFEEHAAFVDGLVGRGIIILGGPVASEDDDDIGLLAVEAADESALRCIFDADPWTVHQVYRIKTVRAWTLWLDGRSRATGSAGAELPNLTNRDRAVRPLPRGGPVPLLGCPFSYAGGGRG